MSGPHAGKKKNAFMHFLVLCCRDMLEESVSDLRTTLCELQERLHSVDGEGEHTSYSCTNSVRFEGDPPLVVVSPVALWSGLGLSTVRLQCHRFLCLCWCQEMSGRRGMRRR